MTAAPIAQGRWSVISAGAMSWVGPLAAALVCLVLMLPYLDHLADYDEFYTLLAARGWLETGAPVIADGAYTRAISFTVLQAAFFSVFGESMVVARMPSLLAVMALAAGLFIWVRHVAGAWSATLTTVIFACTPLTIQMGQFSRFYALHALTVGATALLAYYACLATGRRRVALAAGGLVCLALSMNLQSTTVIALCAIGLWMTAAVMNHLLVRARTWRGRALIVASLLGLIAVGAAVLSLSGIGAFLWNEFQSTTFWGAIPERAENVRYYHQTLDRELGLLWSLFPIAAVVAVVNRGRAMLFAAVFVATTLALHSLAAQKDERYVFYILPFIAVLLGVGLTTAITGYWNWLRRALPDLLGERASFAMIGRVATALAAAGVLFAFANNPPAADVLRMLAGAPKVERLDDSWIANWPAETAALQPIVEPPTILVTSSGMKAIYYLGGYDFELNANVADETDTRRDFGIDERTGRQALSSPASVELLMSCYSDIVFVIDESRWSRDTAVPIATSALIETRAERLPTRPESALLAFRATNASASPSMEMCKELRPGRRR